MAVGRSIAARCEALPCPLKPVCRHLTRSFVQVTKITDMFWQGRGFVAAETHQALAMQYDALQRQVGGQQQLGGQSCRSTAGVKTEGKENGADSKNRNRTNRRSEQSKGRRRRRSRSRGKGEGGSRASLPARSNAQSRRRDPAA